MGIADGEPFLRIVSSRQEKVLVDVTFTGGTVRIVCRECLRIHTIRMSEILRNGSALPID